MRVTEAVGYNEPRDSISQDWLRALYAWDMVPVLIPNVPAEASALLKMHAPDCLIFTGGEDLAVSELRDSTEMRLLEFAMNVGLPIFGVCRGLQLINSYFGGSLGTIENHVATRHPVYFSAAWEEFYGAEAMVNSYHNSSIPKGSLAPDLTIVASDAEGNVEAAIHNRLPITAVMWHPERSGGLPGDVAVIRSML